MSFIKSHLKAARVHIDKKDYLTAKKETIQVLDFEPENYNALATIRFLFSLQPLTSR
jgi:superkiller protein 3